MPVLDSIKQQLGNALGQLSSRDQRALVILLVAAVLLSLYMVRGSLVEANTRQASINERMANQLTEMRQWLPQVAQQGNSNPTGVMRALSSLADQQGIRFSVVQPVELGISLNANNVDQAKLMAWLLAVQTKGYRFNSLSIRPTSQGVSVSAIVEGA